MNVSTLYDPDGSSMVVEPQGPSWTLEELYALLSCSMIEVVTLDEKYVMVIDEEGKFKDVVMMNQRASDIAHQHKAISMHDEIVGKALVTPSVLLD